MTMESMATLLINKFPRGNAKLVAFVGVFGLGYLLGSLRDAPRYVHDGAAGRRALGARADAHARHKRQRALSLTGPSPDREIHVASMCRCPSNLLPVPGAPAAEGVDTGIVQLPSKATGPGAKRFFFHGPADGEGGRCRCETPEPNNPLAPAGQVTGDKYMTRMEPRCKHQKASERYAWDAMPDLAVEQLPVFAGVLSYEAPQSLKASLNNWRDTNLLSRIGVREVMVQLNHRSDADDGVLEEFGKRLEYEEWKGERRARDRKPPHPPVSVTGSPDENLHPGLAISRMCRAAEAHPDSHPNGENLLLFLEKDWNVKSGHQLSQIEHLFRAINSLAQRGVPVVRLSVPVRDVTQTPDSQMWRCPSEGLPFWCYSAHGHRWANTPLVVDCRWFLRYLEPYALLDDPIMHGCRKGMAENGYCDWEAALQDGRVAWTDSQWVVANIAPPQTKLFFHHEVDG